MLDKERFLTPPEIAAHFRVKLGTVRKWRSEGVPMLRVESLTRFRPEEVEMWLRERGNKKEAA